ncbi:MAG: hypothetical protein IPM30_10325 [Burkholderiales bacterium]|nr:hypothetical protein [Burkholderiales bacterium]
MLGDWHATALFWKFQLALLVNWRTLLPVILPLAAPDSLLERTDPPVAQVLARHDVEPRLIEAAVAAMAQAEIAKSANRSVPGTIKEFALSVGVYRDHGGTTDPVELSLRLA